MSSHYIFHIYGLLHNTTSKTRNLLINNCIFWLKISYDLFITNLFTEDLTHFFKFLHEKFSTPFTKFKRNKQFG